MRRKKKLFEIKVYEMNTYDRFYRAESKGVSAPSKTIRCAIHSLLRNLDTIFAITKKSSNKKGAD